MSNQKLSGFYQGGEEGRTCERNGMLSMGLMAMLRGPVMFIGMGVLMATGWAMFIPVAVAGMFTEAILTGAVMVTGCWRLTGAVIFTVLEEIVTGLLTVPRFMLAVLAAVAEAVTGVAEAELHALLVSGGSRKKQDQFYIKYNLNA